MLWVWRKRWAIWSMLRPCRSQVWRWCCRWCLAYCGSGSAGMRGFLGDGDSRTHPLELVGRLPVVLAAVAMREWSPAPGAGKATIAQQGLQAGALHLAPLFCRPAMRVGVQDLNADVIGARAMVILHAAH